MFEDPETGEKHISVDGIIIGGTGTSEFKQLLLAHLPRLLTDQPTSELSVGLGSGILAGESARHAELESITCVEIEPSVVQGAAYFREENHDILANPKLRLVTGDIRTFLLTTTERWAVISADEKTADEYASNGFSYSLDYYRLLNGRLTPGGLVVQWVPATLPPRQYRMILRSFAESFEHVQLWYFLPAYKRGPFNSILVGSRAPLPIEPRAMQARFERRREALKALERFGLTSAEALLPHFVANERVIREAVADAPFNSLAFPRYEFYHPWDYAADRSRKILANHRFILELKRLAHHDFYSQVRAQASDPERMQRTFAAEFRYLEAFGSFLGGITMQEHLRLFDRVLALAPWNDSLRARIYSQYAYLATTRPRGPERERLEARARALYEVETNSQ